MSYPPLEGRGKLLKEEKKEENVKENRRKGTAKNKRQIENKINAKRDKKNLKRFHGLRGYLFFRYQFLFALHII
jgi:hypothetical protein